MNHSIRPLIRRVFAALAAEIRNEQHGILGGRKVEQESKV